ncbi:MAG: hypothetical protein IJ679_07055, partial [Lachnospiraceae bacterium]|nr:hypothetical protein [Lachnospiraceae bacterium]
MRRERDDRYQQTGGHTVRRRRRRRRRPQTTGEWILYYIQSGRLAFVLMTILAITLCFGGVVFAWHKVFPGRVHDEIEVAETEAVEEETAAADAPEEALAEEVFPEDEEPEADFEKKSVVEEEEVDELAASFAPGYTFHRSKKTKTIPEIKEDGTGGTVYSKNGVLVDLDSGEMIAEKEADMVVVPASMTKVLTLIVAVEHIDDLDATFKITKPIMD